MRRGRGRKTRREFLERGGPQSQKGDLVEQGQVGSPRSGARPRAVCHSLLDDSPVQPIGDTTGGQLSESRLSLARQTRLRKPRRPTPPVPPAL